MSNLETTFTLDHPKCEILLCVQDQDDPAVDVWKKLLVKVALTDLTNQMGGGGLPSWSLSQSASWPASSLPGLLFMSSGGTWWSSSCVTVSPGSHQTTSSRLEFRVDRWASLSWTLWWPGSSERPWPCRFSWGSVGSNNQLENRASAISAVVALLRRPLMSSNYCNCSPMNREKVGDQRKRVMMKTVESSESGQTLG